MTKPVDCADTETASTFADAWDRSVAAHPDRPFLIFESSSSDVATYAYGEFDGIVDRASAALVERGAGPGTAVHLALANSVSFVAAWLAATKLGAWVVPSDPGSAERELTEHITRTSAAVGLCASTRREPYLAAAAATGLGHVIEVDESELEPSWLASTGSSSPPTVPPGPLERAAVMFTSGTTGRPKGVEITQANYAFTGQVMAQACDLTEEDRQLVVLPLFHANAQYYSFASAITVGASVALMPAFSASRFLDQARGHRATCASLFAGPMRMILARSTAPEQPVGLRHCWFAQNLVAEQYERLAAWLGCRPRQLYGMTETIPAVLTDERDDPRPDTMGYVSPGCQVDVQDADGRSCDPGEEGEVVVGGVPGRALFAGYLDDPEIKARSFRAGWFLTGDRATRAVDGRYRFCGRRSDTLKVAGENVSTAEVEAVLVNHPRVFEAAVVGAPDPVRDEVPHAFVVTVPGDDGTGVEADLTEWCARHLSKSKRPHAIVVIDELPKTSVGKIRTYVLKEAAAS